MKFLKTIALLTALYSAAASASLQSIHWKSNGDGQVTLDTSTGIEWLDLTVTRGKSIDEVSAMLQSSYAGWRLPTASEMRTLLFSVHEYVIHNDLEYVNSKPASAENIVRHLMMGVTEGNQTSSGLYLNDGGVYAFLSAGYVSGGNGYTYFNHYRGVSTGYKTESSGVYLVSDGGASWSSLNDPSLNINNPNAPINQLPPIADVSTAGWFSLALLPLLFRRNKKAVTTGAVNVEYKA